ncbi:HD domain-containing protein [Alkalimarinus alittae]|uniref:HD domain-containing protein n=1 Tax=Alkalimarinus alittae TaxID=2961619 RepID=A0ABY6MXA4_9ALTE|nr:HD domain-containing protein [Alkalimarinus alittae]UZE94451.1 HD domain-containing protein [Alkalimarinus alittae]
MDYFPEDLLGAHSKLIMDPVHGGIPLFPHEVAILDHPLFQRLRNICQNDILSLVFPGATHSRFLHSIGVMHVGERIFLSMVKSYLESRRYKAKVSTTQEQFFAIDYFNKVIRLACLLHDCGHSSFSHQFTKTSKIKDMMESSGLFQKLWAGIDTQDLYDATPTIIEHEHYSSRCAHQLLTDTGVQASGIELIDVLAIMETTSATTSAVFNKHAEYFWQFITGSKEVEWKTSTTIPQLVAELLSSIISGEVDADRADYMLRDGFHSSVTIGGFNLDHLLSNLRFGWDPQTPWLGLAITSKGLSALEDFVYSRNQMYRNVYGHKTALGFDWLLREAINEVLEENDISDYVEQCLTDLDEFRHLTDNYFWECFRHHARKHPDSYSYCIINRVKLKHIDTQYDLPPDQIERRKQALADQLKLDKTAVVSCTMNAKFSKIREDFDQMKVLVKDAITHKHRLKLIPEVSTFFNKFTDGTITHFYLKPKRLG